MLSAQRCKVIQYKIRRLSYTRKIVSIHRLQMKMHVPTSM